MENPTISERVAADQITVRSVLVGTHSESHGMWQEWVCVFFIPDESARFYLAEPEDRADGPNEESSVQGRTLVVNRVGLSVKDRDEGNVPDAVDGLQMVCQDAVNIENSGDDFWAWWGEVGSGEAPTESDYRDWEEIKINTRNLKVFLGDKCADYLWKTEWQ